MALRPKIVKLIDKYSQKRGAFSSPLPLLIPVFPFPSSSYFISYSVVHSIAY
jgi:hypothetical protein